MTLFCTNNQLENIEENTFPAASRTVDLLGTNNCFMKPIW